MTARFYFPLLLCLAAACSTRQSGTNPVYLDFSAPLEDRVEDALSRMTLEEKVSILHAQSKFSSAGVQRLGIPDISCSDGPNGVRQEVLWDDWHHAGWTNDSCVAFPALTALAATWDRELAGQYGKALGEEARFREKNIILGPGVNIFRTPLCGRNFEYLGEDPYLASQLVVPYIRNVQKNGVSACVKHFCLNNEETYRNQTDVYVSDRALHEIYLPVFKAAVKDAGTWSLMTSYNKYEGDFTSHSHKLLSEILKEEWGFDGVVVSDWGSIHDTEAAVKAGMDMEFGTSGSYSDYYLADPYLAGLKEGKFDMNELDDKCRRVLRLIFRTAMNPEKPFGSLCSDEHYAIARKVGAAGIVLLKNDGGLLPVRKDVHRIAVIGENALKRMTIGGGAASLKVQHEISILQGIKERAGDDVEVIYARGYVGSPTTYQDGILVGAELIDGRSADELTAEAIHVAASADVVIFVGGMNKDGGQDCEGFDRPSIDLLYGQNELINALAEANPNIVVALVSGNAVSMPWIDTVPSVLQTWYLGSEAGHAFADVLFGDVNPSGKLPFTFPKQLGDSPAHYAGKAFPNPDRNDYVEGIYVGYRWYEKKDIQPLFAFGHGLSYTEFEYGQAKVSRATIRNKGSLRIRVPVTNIGKRAGSEVVQLYISDVDCSLDRPEKELKGFEKVYLLPGETKTVTFNLSEDLLQYYDETAGTWVSEPGEFEAKIAAASDDIKGTDRFSLK